jgi:hypothetical protein
VSECVCVCVCACMSVCAGRLLLACGCAGECVCGLACAREGLVVGDVMVGGEESSARSYCCGVVSARVADKCECDRGLAAHSTHASACVRAS